MRLDEHVHRQVHLDHQIELRQPAGDEVRQWFVLAYVCENVTDRINDIRLVRVPHSRPGLLQRVPEIAQVAIGQFKRKSHANVPGLLPAARRNTTGAFNERQSRATFR